MPLINKTDLGKKDKEKKKGGGEGKYISHFSSQEPGAAF